MFKCKLKKENVFEVQWSWRNELGITIQTQVTTVGYVISSKVMEQCKITTRVDREHFAHQLATNSCWQCYRPSHNLQTPKNSQRQCSSEIGVRKTSVHHILLHEKWGIVSTEIAACMNADDPCCRAEFGEWVFHICDGRFHCFVRRSYF